MLPNAQAPTAKTAAAAPVETKPAMTASQAAKLVRRPVTTMVASDEKDGQGKPVMKPVTEQVKVGTDEVLAFTDYGTHVVVVNKDGQKFSSADEA